MATATAYTELKCNGCKQLFMLPSESLENPKLIKRCPHCLGKRFRPTDQLGIAVTRKQFRDAIETWLYASSPFEENTAEPESVEEFLEDAVNVKGDET